MPGTAEQPMEVNVLDTSWTSEVFSWLKCVGLDQGGIKIHLPEEDFSWSPTLKERKYHHNSKQTTCYDLGNSLGYHAGTDCIICFRAWCSGFPYTDAFASSQMHSAECICSQPNASDLRMYLSSGFDTILARDPGESRQSGAGYVQSKSTDREHMDRRGARTYTACEARRQTRTRLVGHRYCASAWQNCGARDKCQESAATCTRSRRQCQAAAAKTAPRARAKEATRRGGTRGCDVLSNEYPARLRGSSAISRVKAAGRGSWFICKRTSCRAAPVDGDQEKAAVLASAEIPVPTTDDDGAAYITGVTNQTGQLHNRTRVALRLPGIDMGDQCRAFHHSPSRVWSINKLAAPRSPLKKGGTSRFGSRLQRTQIDSPVLLQQLLLVPVISISPLDTALVYDYREIQG
ncbi:hypothetical protein B0H14DRAFT_3729772 [Mycena olivaceomarginata]|nr:hypothetical protein B0H14DRAFT_3729772 [Mycena olivaceomarginata]